MKRKFYLIIFIFTILFIIPKTTYADEYKGIDVGHERISIKNRKLVDSDGNEFVMKGIAVVNVFQKELKADRYSVETFKLLKEAGFNTIRFQVSIEHFYDLENDTFNESNLEILKTILDNAYKAGIYIILDIHTLTIGDVGFYTNKTGKKAYIFINEDGSEYEDDFINTWKKLAEIGRNYKSVIAYELMNEPQCAYHSTQEAVYNYYSEVLQKTIDTIREVDDETIICFQPVHNYRKMDLTYVTPSFTKYPNVTGTNLLLDSNHEYSNQIHDLEYKTINMTAAIGTSTEAGIYKSANVEKNFTSTSITLKQEMTCDKDCRLSWVALRAKNMNGVDITPTGIRIYKILDDKEVLAFEAYSTDSVEKLTQFKINDKFITQSITSDAQNVLSTGLVTNLNVGLYAGDKIRVEIDADLSKLTENAQLVWQYTVTPIVANKYGSTIVQGRERLENLFKYLDDASKQYGSPLFWGEFCVMSNYINEFTNYKDYVDDFTELSKEYHLNWIWHRMSEYPSDNGYGAYVNGIIPTVENRRSSMWEYIIPTILSTPGEYYNESLDSDNNNDSKDNTDNVTNPKTGVKYNLDIFIIVVMCLILLIIKLKNKSKFKSI